ncbi:MAG TPA: cyclase [Armatimonadota bacterium]
MASYMLVRHKVRDFSEWKPGYDAHQPKRLAAGLTDKKLLRSADDPNEVILLFEAADLDRAKAFAESADLKETMQNVGVIDKPDVYFLNG